MIFLRKIMDGNTAASSIAYLFSEVCSIYPITPSSTMASNIDKMNGEDYYNLFHEKVRLLEMQSEAGAAGAMHGALLTGALSSSFTASQGLLLMIPNMYKMAGECLPGVIHVASRTVATHALSIFGDHSDIYATRQTGFCMLCSNNPQESYHMALVAHLSAIKGSLPFLHFFDGFRTSHEINSVEIIDEKDILPLFDKEAYQRFQEKSLNLGKNIERGLSETEDIYFQSLEARGGMYDAMPDIVNFYMEKVNELAGTSYKPFSYYGSKEAKHVIVAMGSVCDTIKLVVQKECELGNPIGLLEVHLYRPFSTKYFESVLPKTVTTIAVLDRTKESGSIGEPLYLDVVAALHHSNIFVVGGRYGISGKNTTPQDIYSVYQMLKTAPRHNFTIGILDDVSCTSLDTTSYSIDLGTYELQIYGYGSDGMVSASKDLLHILGETKYVQGYFSYDSKKSGGVTVSHLRIGDKPIHAPYYLTNIDMVVVTKMEYFQKYSLLEHVKENSILLVNSKDDMKFMEFILKANLEMIEKKNIQIYSIDADGIAIKHHLAGKISKIMEAAILKLLGHEDKISLLKDAIRSQFQTKGEEIVLHNQEAVEEVSLKLKRIFVTNSKPCELSFQTIYEQMNARLGDKLSVSKLLPLKEGIFPGGLAILEKRKSSSSVPKWKSENCIQCGMCSFVCPHAVIRPFVIEEEQGIPLIGDSNYHYMICVSEADCTGCGLCVNVCPGKNGEKALYMGEYDEDKQSLANSYFKKGSVLNPFSLFTIKGSQFETPKFEFSGACAGCGETAYIKLLTQLFGNEILICNATGCSSIYGGSAPSTPYSLPWANSLFEDNAEFSYGMHLSFQSKRERIKHIMLDCMDSVESDVKKLFQEFLQSFDDFKETLRITKELKEKEIPNDLKELMDYLPSRTIWAIGGDGWAYDIGFSGIDHVLSSFENIKILVLDTEVYSNTGGQMSKSSPLGAVAEFADFGKRTYKKDFFRIAMSYPNCYVASISLGANMMQAIRVFKEASEHKGPSIIFAYATCIEQGIKGGMGCSLEEQKLAVLSGYTLLMRYKPEEDKLYLDSKKPDFSRYDEFLNNEVRYRALKIKDSLLAAELLEENKNQAMKRYQYYESLVKED